LNAISATNTQFLRPSQTTTFQDPFSEEVWRTTYRDYKDTDINDTFWRVACAIASVEVTEELRKKWSEIFYEMLCEFKIVPGGRILANAGTEFKGTTLINCFVLPNPPSDFDSIEGIIKYLRYQSLTLKSEGGAGACADAIRPRGTFIHGIGVETPGAVKFFELFDKSSDIITAGSGKKSSNKKAKGKIRKGAQMLSMSVWHPDIIEFITAKQTPGRLAKFNVSVNCTNEFMDKVNEVATLQKNKASQEEIDSITWDLIFPDTTFSSYKKEWFGDINLWKKNNYPVKVHQTVKVDWLWKLITTSTYNRNEPGILFLDRSNYFNPYNYDITEVIKTTNPCISLNSWITTSDGPRHAKDLLGRQFTAIVDGKEWLSSDKGFFISGEKQLLEITTNAGYSMKVTEEHKFEVYRNKEKLKITAKELLLDDELILNNHRYRNVEVSEKDDIIGYTLGMLIGDGYISGNKSHLCSWGQGDGPKNVRKKILEGIHYYGNPNKKFKGWCEVTGRNEFRLRCRDLDFLAESFGLSATNKHITKELEENLEISKGILRGIFDADGSVQGTPKSGMSIRLAQNNIEDLKTVQRMLARLGIISKLCLNRRKAQWRSMPDGKGGSKEYFCKAQHELIISKDNILFYFDKVGFYDLEKKEKCWQLLREYSYGTRVESFRSKVIAIENKEIEVVVDCEIPGCNLFDCNGLQISNCGEQQMPPSGCCDLGTLNLTQFINKERTGLDLAKIKKYTKYLTRFLDNVNSYSDAPLPEYIDSMRKKRRIGCGLMGWGSSLFILKIRFGSEEAKKIQSEVLKAFTHAGIEASVDLAEEKGMFEFCQPEKHALSPYWDSIDLPVSIRNRMRKYGIRNSSNFSMQPNGNSSVLANILTGGIEPAFLHEYTRTVIVSITPDHIVDVTPNWSHGDFVETEMFKFAQEGDEQILRGVDKFGTVYKIDKNRGLTKEVLCEDYGVRYLKSIGEWDALAPWAVTSENLSVTEHISDLMGFAKATDSACSKTINIPNDYSFEDFQNIYLDSYNTGYIKGVTSYRASTMTSVLSAVASKYQDEEVILTDTKMPDTSIAEVKVLRDHEGGSSRKWYCTIGLNENKAPISLFVQTNAIEKSVTTNDAVDKLLALARTKGIPEKFVAGVEEKFINDNNSSKIARTIGLLLRHGVKISNVVAEIDKVEGVTFASFLFHIKKLLSGYIRDNEVVHNEKCIECSGKMIYESGCKKCIQCGHSMCG